ncbi:oxidative stress survival, Svf1-like protein [Microdochium trichocladiopsis]|uniref:Oxidative stress survival, Svf1-like protein n=1 Tax=Microdochium trichocladiopsis TaxID=1682393 RepID=A0A9P8Y8U3_9PEZI|nr:oxidative stress survival, Svf1-like protein [Microdochium trichocladiopsis]KAH7031086.1 oxidative stress survival, Svf1-like protein [Microdochium trichocladiopsis]
MFAWAKKTLADAVGTEEPIYGPSAIQSVAEEAKTTPYTELTRDDMKWIVMNSTSVETMSFYLMSDSGHLALAQVIYSNVAGIRTTVQFNTKVFYPDGSKPHLWSSTPLSEHEFSEDKTAFYAKDCAVELSEDGKSYSIKSMNDQKAIVNLKVTQSAPGFVVGKKGFSYFGTDPANPWGSIRHAFWPRCVAEGTILTQDGPIDFKGKAFLSFAIQGMKPHHAAARWNFVDFQGPTHSAILMEYTTPPSYGSTSVPVGGVAKDGEIILGGASCSITHTKTLLDEETGWAEPAESKYVWTGTTKDGKPVEVVMEVVLEKRQDRVDIMDEVPGFVKKIVAGAVGTKPYIFQYIPVQKAATLKLKVDDQEVTEEGQLFVEATFISGMEGSS